MGRARTVLITGGLGGATAAALAARGWHVVVGGRDRAHVDAVVARLDRTSADGYELTFDVFALDPGLMLETDLAREVPAPVRAVVSRLGPALSRVVPGMRRQETSATHVADLVDRPAWSGRGFAHLDGDRERPPSRDALRDDLADGLRVDGSRLVGLRQDERVLGLA